MTPLANQGKLPVLSKLMAEGTNAKLRSVIPPLTPAAWTAQATGKNPGKHGIYDFLKRKKASYKTDLVTAQDRRVEAIWNILSKAGRRVGILNVPMTYPPEPVNGFMISGLGTPESRRDFTYPAGLLDEIEKNVGRYRIWHRSFPRPDAADEFLSDIFDIVDCQTKAARYLMGKEKWDFFMIVYQIADWAQHYYWKYCDESHPAFDKSSPAHTVIERTYCKLDSLVGELLQAKDHETDVIVMSDHGMGSCAKNVYVNNWLAVNNYLKYKRGLRYALYSLGFTSELVLRIVVSLGLGDMIVNARESKESLLKLFLTNDDIDWSKTVAYSYGNDGKIVLNLKGREPQGIIEQGPQFENTRDEIIQRLKNFVDPETGESVCDAVYKSDDVFNGPYAPGPNSLEGADIVPLMSRYHQDFHWVSKSVLGPAPDNISANHRLHGIFILKGQEIKHGVTIPEVSILDPAPTILYLMGIPIPKDMDGKLITAAIEDEHLKSVSPVYTEAQTQQTQDTSMTTEDEEEIMNRLRALGYVA
jgi:predicted AlkP superfamily phosphohydrolase/phosphomutase